MNAAVSVLLIMSVISKQSYWYTEVHPDKRPDYLLWTKFVSGAALLRNGGTS